jgi:hypothetical protein
MTLIKKRTSGCIHGDTSHQEIKSGIQNQNNSVLKPTAGSIFISETDSRNKGYLERKITLEAKQPSFPW